MMEWAIKHWVEALFAAVAALFSALYARAVAAQKRDRIRADAMGRGVQALLRDRIVQLYYSYTERGYCPVSVRENIEALHKEYVNLGGNGTVDDLVGDLYQLPKGERE